MTEGATVSLTRRSPSPPPLDGEIRFEARARAAAAEDFGHLVHHTPEGVVLPASDEDVAAAVRWAAERLAALTHLARAALGRPDGDRGTA
jgi:cytokinin dehydrogenase